MTDFTGTTIRTYDGLNRNTSKIVPYIGKSTYEYDLPAEKAGEYTERTTDPKGNVTEKTYDQVSRLSKVTIDGKTTAYQYYLNGNRYSVIYPNGTKETYEYNHNNQVTKLVNKKEDGKLISSFQYTYDASGNQITKIEEKGTTNYTYDNLNRLSTVTEPDGKETSYTYDGAGNRKSEQVKKGQEYVMTVYTYDDQNRLSKTLSSSGTEIKYIYDNNGNLINKSTSTVKPMKSDGLSPEDLPSFDIIIRKEYEYGTGTPEITYYSYDKYNRLVQTKSKDTTAEYSYNAQGYRVEKSVNNKITRYLYEADKVVLETDESNNQKAFQAYGSNLIYRTTTEDDLGAQSYYYLYNAHGDVTELINTTGVIAISYDYDAFGNVIKEDGKANNSILYAGYQYDKESGLYYLNARYYDSVTARFITEDTYRGQVNDPLSLNLYTYCSNNPVIYIDPSGHKNLIARYKEEKDKEYKETIEIETKLSHLGYNVGKVDGKSTKNTTNAIKQFQKDNGLKPTGVIDAKTNKTINISYNKDVKVEEERRKAEEAKNNNNRETDNLVTAEQLTSIGFENVTADMVSDLNKTLVKYNITTTEQIQYFLTEVMAETSGYDLVEDGSDKYLGGGYLQLTFPYGYQAFASYMIMEAHPDLKAIKSFASINPECNGASSIATDYQELVKEAKSKGYNIDEYTNIVDKGKNYVATNYAWESAGYFWSEVKDINSVIANSSGDTLLAVSITINGKNKNGYPNGWNERQAYYKLVCSYIK